MRGTPDRTDELEVRLAGDLRPLARHDTHAAQRVVQVAEREPRDVRQASRGRLDETLALALDRIRTGLVERLAARDVAVDLAERQLAQCHARTYGELRSRTARGDDHDIGAHVVLAARERCEHRDR